MSSQVFPVRDVLAGKAFCGPSVDFMYFLRAHPSLTGLGQRPKKSDSKMTLIIDCTVTNAII